jgi:hypothetical protein
MIFYPRKKNTQPFFCETTGSSVCPEEQGSCSFSGVTAVFLLLRERVTGGLL